MDKTEKSLKMLDKFSVEFSVANFVQKSEKLILIILKAYSCPKNKVSLLEVDSLWGDETFIPADWGSL